VSTALHLCTTDDAPVLTTLIARFHDEFGLEQDPDSRASALAPLLGGSPYGAAYLLGPRKAPVGYLVVTFGWGIELGGMEAWIDEIYVRPNVRGRGIATEVLAAIARVLRGAGVKVIHLEVARDDAAAIRLYQRSGFALRDRYALMSQSL